MKLAMEKQRYAHIIKTSSDSIVVACFGGMLPNLGMKGDEYNIALSIYFMPRMSHHATPWRTKARPIYIAGYAIRLLLLNSTLRVR